MKRLVMKMKEQAEKLSGMMFDVPSAPAAVVLLGPPIIIIVVVAILVIVAIKLIIKARKKNAKADSKSADNDTFR